MLLQDLLIMNGIDTKRIKLIRHNITNNEIAENLKNNCIEEYQRVQRPNRFKDCDYIVSFLGLKGTEGRLMGCYKVDGFQELQQGEVPNKVYFSPSSVVEGRVCFDLTKTTLLKEFIDRLVIEWGKAAISWCQNGTTEKEILYILPAVSPYEFISYDKVLLSFGTLEEIVRNRKQHKIWEDKLSSVAGIYLITDTSTGKHYVGSASGEIGGIWGRWCNYAKTKHGGNTGLIKILEQKSEQYRNFQYSILEIFPIKRDKHEILAYEALYKKKLCSIPFGMNDN